MKKDFIVKKGGAYGKVDSTFHQNLERFSDELNQSRPSGYYGKPSQVYGGTSQNRYRHGDSFEDTYGFSNQEPEWSKLYKKRDDILGEVESALEYCHRHDNLTEEECHDALDSIESCLSELVSRRYGYNYGSINDLEDMIREVQAWGEEWRDFGANLAQQHPEDF